MHNNRYHRVTVHLQSTILYIFIYIMMFLPVEQLTDIYLQKNRILRASAGRSVPHCFLLRHVDCVFPYVRRQQQNCETECQDSEDPDHGVVLCCVVLRCAFKHEFCVCYTS